MCSWGAAVTISQVLVDPARLVVRLTAALSKVKCFTKSRVKSLMSKCRTRVHWTITFQPLRSDTRSAHAQISQLLAQDVENPISAIYSRCRHPIGHKHPAAHQRLHPLSIPSEVADSTAECTSRLKGLVETGVLSLALGFQFMGPFSVSPGPRDS